MNENQMLKQIKTAFPDLEHRTVEINQDGMVNIAVIINRERVFRFPRRDAGRELMAHEMRVIDLISPSVDLPIPNWDYRSNEMISYPFIKGKPFLTDDLYRFSEKEKDEVAEKLATFLKSLHSIPVADAKRAGIHQSETVRNPENWVQFYADIETHLFPLMWADGREWVRRHFAPFLADHSLWEHEPVFIHGDLATYHLLYDFDAGRFSGVIDFGTAGIGDSAVDFAVMINQYGESFLRRMQRYYPEIKAHITRSRFRAGTLELQWVLSGLKNNANDMFVVHIGRARDVRPVDSGWSPNERP
ncbi:MAG: phosphotransferase [Chloroflexota bacterium]